MLSDENVDLVAAGLRNSSTVYLERGTRLPTDSVILTIALVTGNSVEAKYCPAEAGVRGLEVEITASLQDTVESVRDQAGVLLLGYAPGWTQRCDVFTKGTGARNHLGEDVVVADVRAVPAAGLEQYKKASLDSAHEHEQEQEQEQADLSMEPKAAAIVEFGAEFSGRRLRKTSWLKEPTELLAERVEEIIQAKPAKSSAKASAAAKAPVNAAPLTVERVLTVKDVGIKSGDTLLLEDGTLPVNGQFNLQASSTTYA